MIPHEQLPPFAPNGAVREFIEDAKGGLHRAPWEGPLFWKHHPEGEWLLLGSRWKVDVYESEILLSTGAEETRYDRGDWRLADLMDHLQKKLQIEHPELCCGVYLAFEAGWDGETRRMAAPDAPTPWLSVFCPEEVLVRREGGWLSLRDRLQESRMLAEDRTFSSTFASSITIEADQTRELYLDQVNRIKERIRSGDTFQVNLSQGFTCDTPHDLDAWAQHALSTQGSFHSGYWRSDAFSVLSLSPESLVHGEGSRITTRPIAGTLPRSEHTTEKDLEDFRSHPKELAEHNMLIDLERNDLGKVSLPGSVKVSEYLTLETLPHVVHLVSEVEGEMEPNLGAGHAAMAMFPGGTITGCPKLETMHILDDVEQGQRGAYTGSFGLLHANAIDLNILIRSAMTLHSTTHMRFGGGIVWDSDPSKEYMETLAKARGLLRTLLEGGAILDPDHRSLRQLFP